MIFYLYNQGTCTRLKLVGEELSELLIKNRWINTRRMAEAEIIFVNSCSFLKVKEDEFMKLIKEVWHRKQKCQKLAVFGCLPATSKEKITLISSEIIQFNRDLDRINDYFELQKHFVSVNFTNNEKLSTRERFILFLNRYLIGDEGIKYRLKKDEVFHLKISDGCQGKCSYCSEKFTTRFKSRPAEQVISAFKKGLAAGYRLFVLNSDDTAAFGEDNQESITRLLADILKNNSSFRLAISEFNPRGLFLPDILSYLADQRIIYITIPVQSGSNKILSKMKRPYAIEEVMSKLKELKRRSRNLKINTHVIVGFPGENAEDFQKTVELIKSGIFDRVKIFEYSDRPGTEASLMKGKVPAHIIRRRRNIVKKILFQTNLRQRSLSNLLLNSKSLS